MDNGVNVKTKAGQRALTRAVIEGRGNIVRRLVKGGAEVTKLDDDYLSPLYYAVSRKKKEIVKLLVEGADVEPQDLTKALGWTSTEDIARVLIEQKADVNEALFEVAKRKEWKIVSLLVEEGAQVNKLREDGQTVLHLAAEEMGNEIAQDTVRLLLKKGARLDIKDRDGCKPEDLMETEQKDIFRRIVAEVRSQPLRSLSLLSYFG